MKREAESYVSKNNFDKSSEQEAIAIEGLRRCEGDSPIVGGTVTGQHEIIHESAIPIATNDATLNFAGGPPVATISPYGEIPFTGALERAAGVGAVERASTSLPSDLGRAVVPAPLCVESHTGSHMNTEEILGKTRR